MKKNGVWETISMRAAIAGIIAIALLCYIPMLFNEFCLDDIVIQEAPYPRTIGECCYLFVERVPHGLMFMYRPITFITFTLDYVLWGYNPFGYHLTNALASAATAIALFFLAKHFLPLPYAFLASAFFAVLPGHSEAVAGVFNRSQVICTFWIIIAQVCMMELLKRGQQRWMWWAALSTLLGCFSKESALVTPVLSLLLCCLCRPLTRVKVVLSAAICLQGLACLTYLMTRRLIMGSIGYANPDSFLAGTSLMAHYFNSCRLLTMYFRLALFPTHLSCDYPLRLISFHWSGFLYPPAMICALYLLWQRRSLPLRLFAFCFLWFVIALAPALHILPLQMTFAERVLYTASPGIAIAFALFFSKVRGRKRHWAWVIVAGLMLLTGDRCLKWRNDLTLWGETLRTTPHSYRARMGLASHCFKKGYYSQGLSYCEDALKYHPNRYNEILIYYNLHVAWSSVGNAKKANFYRDCVLKLDPVNPYLCRLLGDRAYRDLKWEEALAWYRKLPGPANRWDKEYEEIHRRISECRGHLNGH